MWQDLSLDIAQEFSNPYWLDISLRAARLSHGMRSDSSNCQTVTRRSDELFADSVRELLPTQYTWTSRELAKAAGDDTQGAAIVCGRILLADGWQLLKIDDKHVWTNPGQLLQWCENQSFISLRDAGKQLGVGAKVLAPLLRSAGWSEARRGTKRVWTRSSAREVRNVG